MTSAEVGAGETGRTCPYCRFPLKPNVPVVRCDACGSLYHRECWEEGGGCAILGCANAAPGPATGAVAAQGLPPPQAPPPERAHAGGRGNRTLFVGILAGALLAGAAVAGFVLVHGSTGGKSTQRASPAATGSPAPPSTTSVVTREEEAAAELSDLVQLSREGRAAVVAHRYDAAIANRQNVLARLRTLSPRTARLERAKASFTRAMQMSLQSDERYANGLDATDTDKAATRLKRKFVRLFDPIAADYGLESVSADDI